MKKTTLRFTGIYYTLLLTSRKQTAGTTPRFYKSLDAFKFLKCVQRVKKPESHLNCSKKLVWGSPLIWEDQYIKFAFHNMLTLEDFKTAHFSQKQTLKKFLKTYVEICITEINM